MKWKPKENNTRGMRWYENEGHKCKIMADINAHVGTQPIGIEGN